MIDLAPPPSERQPQRRLTELERIVRRLDQRAAHMKRVHDERFAAGLCINTSKVNPHAPAVPGGRRCPDCRAKRRKAQS